jgi:hypothetical protein
LIYGCVFAAANVFPYKFLQEVDQQHGWPFGYMLRETRVPGGFTVFYGMWPVYDPPLIWFRPTALLLDVCVATLLMCLTVPIAEYWLRMRPKYLRLTQRRLVGLAAVLVGLVSFVEFNTGGSGGLWKYLELFCFCAQWLIYVTPILLVVTAARWLVLRSADSQRRCRWPGIHWLTWLALTAFTVSFLHYCLFTHTGYTSAPGTHKGSVLQIEAYGWPFRFMGEWDRPIAVRLRYAEDGYAISCFRPLALSVDVPVWLVVITLTGFVIERWIRRVERGVQMHPGVILAVVVVVAIMICVLGKDESFRPKWYDYPSWLFGIACSMYAICVLIIRGVVWSLRKSQGQVAPTPPAR